MFVTDYAKIMPDYIRNLEKLKIKIIEINFETKKFLKNLSKMSNL